MGAAYCMGRSRLVSVCVQPVIVWDISLPSAYCACRHVNNVRYVRFFESGRIKWMTVLGHKIGGPSAAEALLKGKGIALILKSIEVKFRRPVTFPDTLLVAYRPRPPSSAASAKTDPASFHLTASAYSLSQRAFVAHSNEEMVWYDYDKLKKCDPGEKVRDAVWSMIKKQS